MTKKEKRFFNIAKEISYLGDYKRTRVGAVVVEKNHILSTGFNAKKTRPLQHKYNIYRNLDDYENSVAMQHAEIDALSPLIGKDIDWSKVSIYVYRELKDGQKACSRPCVACGRLIKDLGIKEVYYINNYGDYVKEKILDDFE
ncbi:MAG: hypothetical protein IKU01_01590 [Bacteroidales bacterium]|nr:hypothetical protein [Bacteroidales bacterium]